MSSDSTLGPGRGAGGATSREGAAGRVGLRGLMLGPVIVWVLAGFAVHVLVHQLNIVSIGGFPAGYYLAGQVAPLVLAAVCFWIALRRRKLFLSEAANFDTEDSEPLNSVGSRSGRWARVFDGARAAGAVFGGGLLVALTGAAFAQGYDGFAYLLGVMSAFVAVSVFYLPAFAGTGATSISRQLMHVYGSRIVSLLGGAVAVICLVLLLGADILAVGYTLARMLAISPRDGVLLGAVALTIVAIGAIAVPRLLSLALAVSILAVIFALCIASGVVSIEQYRVLVPHIGHGLALPDVTGLERHLLLDGLADPVSLKQHIQPRTHFDIVNFFAIAATLAVGFGALVTLALAHQSRDVLSGPPPPPAERLCILSSNAAWLGFFACLVVVSVPAVATLGKLELLQALSEQIPLATLPTWVAPYTAAGQLTICGETDLSIATLMGACNDPERRLALQDIALAPEAVLLAGSEFSGALADMSVAMAVVICFSALACGAATVRALGREIQGALSASRAACAAVGTGVGVGVAAYTKGFTPGQFVFLIIGVAAGVLVAVVSGVGALILICVSASLAAACLFPAIVIGAAWRRVSAFPAAASIVTGACVCGYYAIGTMYFADTFALRWQMISSAPEWQIDQLRSLQIMCAQAAVGECEQVPAIAREAANWFGIETSASALFALPASVVVLVMFALILPRRSTAVPS